MDSKVFETKETFKDWDTDYYHPIAQRYYDRAIPTMLRLMNVDPQATILDAGCGPGVHSIRVAQNNHRVCAVDISDTMLCEARNRVAKSGVSDLVKFQKEDLTNLSFPSASFQYVFSWGVIIHIHDIEKALDELARVVAPNGKLALYVTNKTALENTIEPIARFLVRKPKLGLQKLPMGNGIWYEMNGEKLWVWNIDTNYLTNYLQGRGFKIKHHIIGEFTESQRRVKGELRKLLLRLNNLCYSLKIPPSLGSTNLLVFEKTR